MNVRVVTSKAYRPFVFLVKFKVVEVFNIFSGCADVCML